MIKYVDFDLALLINREAMRRLGEASQPFLLGGEHKLASALMRAEAAAYYGGADLVVQATRLGIGVARAHAFVDGNKRTAQLCLVFFLAWNDCPLPDDEDVAQLLAELLEELQEPDLSDDEAEAQLEAFLRRYI